MVCGICELKEEEIKTWRRKALDRKEWAVKMFGRIWPPRIMIPEKERGTEYGVGAILRHQEYGWLLIFSGHSHLESQQLLKTRSADHWLDH